MMFWMFMTCSKCGLDATKYKGHSFRIGGATSLAHRGYHSSLVISCVHAIQMNVFQLHRKQWHNKKLDIQIKYFYMKLKQQTAPFKYARRK